MNFIFVTPLFSLMTALFKPKYVAEYLNDIQLARLQYVGLLLSEQLLLVSSFIKTDTMDTMALK